MQDRLDLSSTRVSEMEDKLGALHGLMSHHKKKKAKAKAKAEEMSSRIQLTGRSISSVRKTTDGVGNLFKTKSFHRSSSHAVLYDKMETKYKTLRKAFRSIDEDGDQRVSWPEMQRLLINFNMDPNDKALHQLFTAADKDNSGSIEYPEFQSHFGEILQPSAEGGIVEETIHNRSEKNHRGRSTVGLHHRLHRKSMKNIQLSKESIHVSNTRRIDKVKNSSSKTLSYATADQEDSSSLKKPNRRASSSHDLLMHKVQTKFSSLRGAFRWIDENSDGEVSWSELQRLLETFNMDLNDPILKQLFRLADRDSDGAISYQEFQRYFGELIQPSIGGGQIHKLPNDQQGVNLDATQTTVKRTTSTVPLLTLESGRKSSKPILSTKETIKKGQTLSPKRNELALSSSPLTPVNLDLRVKIREKIVTKLQKHEWKQLYKALRRTDAKRFGTLNRGEFATVLMKFGICLSVEELDYIASEIGSSEGNRLQTHRGSTPRAGASHQRVTSRPSSAITRGRGFDQSWGNSLRRYSSRAEQTQSNLKQRRPMTAFSRGNGRVLPESLRRRKIKYPDFMKIFVMRQTTAKVPQPTQRAQSDLALATMTLEHGDLLK